MKFLSDELFEIGKNANPKSNISMMDASVKMLEILETKRDEIPMKKLYNITSLVCKQLNKEGFKFYKPEMFFEI